MPNASEEKFDWNKQREAIIGLGDRSLKKNYYPELRRRLRELEFFHLMLDHSGDGVVLLEIPSWNVVDFNLRFQRMVNLKRDEMTGRNFYDLTGIDRVFEELNEGLENLKDVSISHDCEIVDASGNRGAVEINVTRTKVFGKFMGIAVIRDITMRLEAEAAVRESERRYRSYIHESPTGIFVSNPDGIFVDANPAACELCGYSLEELKKMSLSDVTHADDLQSVVDSFSKLKESGSLRDTKRLYSKAGELQYIDMNVVMIEDGLIMAYCTDVTASKKAEAELCRAKEIAEAASQAKDEFIAVMSHEMRTPLNPILGFASLLQDLVTDQDQLQYIDSIMRSANTQLSLIDQLLHFTRLSKGDINPSRDEFDVMILCSNVVQDAKASAGHLDLQLESIEELPVVPEGMKVISDQTMLQQVLDNLVGNACKYTHEGKVALRTGVVSSDKDKICIRFEVTDTGIVIPADSISNLFSPFTQVDMSYTRKYGGVGLGLAICRKLMDILGSHIAVESIVGKGSRFWFDLPLIAVEKQEEKAVDRRSHVNRLKEEVSVLIVEDSPDNAQVANVLISYLGGRSKVVGNGQMALDACEQEVFDLILMDLSMPVMNGFEAAERIVNSENPNRNTPIIALTAHAAQDAKRKCLEAGMRDCLEKPVDLGLLYAAMSHL